MTVVPQTSVRNSVPLSIAGWAAVGFVLLYTLAVDTAQGRQLDEAAMRWTAVSVTQDGWTRALLTAVSARSVLLFGAMIALTTALVRGLRVAALGALSAAVVLLGAETLKLALIRPDFSSQTLTNSFPSGHVGAVTGLAVALLMAAPRGRWRRAALVVAAAAVTLTGVATVALEWHRPSDVLGSVLLGVVVSVTAGRWEPLAVQRQRQKPSNRSRLRLSSQGFHVR